MTMKPFLERILFSRFCLPNFDHKFSCAAWCSTSLGGSFVVVECISLCSIAAYRGGLTRESADEDHPSQNGGTGLRSETPVHLTLPARKQRNVPLLHLVPWPRSRLWLWGHGWKWKRNCGGINAPEVLLQLCLDLEVEFGVKRKLKLIIEEKFDVPTEKYSRWNYV